MPHFISTMTFGDLLFLVGLVFYGGMSYAQLRTVATRMSRLEERVVTLTGELQRVIGAFELHVREG
mgnify:CR=1 FL=1